MLNVSNNYMTISIGQRMVNELRAQLFDHLQRLSLSFHRRREIGDLMVRIVYDTFSIQTITMNGIFPMLVVADSARRDVHRDDPNGRDDDADRARVIPMLILLIMSVSGTIDASPAARGSRRARLYTVAHRALAAIHVVQAFTREAESYREFVGPVAKASTRTCASTPSKQFTPAGSAC